MRPTLLATVVLLAACSRSAQPGDGRDAGAATVALAPTPKPFGAPCTTDAECAGTVCFHRRIKEEHAAREQRDAANEAVERDGYCSIRCRDDVECPVPLTRGKCGARGMCKRAE